jgi:hypothetical protein
LFCVPLHWLVRLSTQPNSASCAHTCREGSITQQKITHHQKFIRREDRKLCVAASCTPARVNVAQREVYARVSCVADESMRARVRAAHTSERMARGPFHDSHSRAPPTSSLASNADAQRKCLELPNRYHKLARHLYVGVGWVGGWMHVVVFEELARLLRLEPRPPERVFCTPCATQAELILGAKRAHAEILKRERSREYQQAQSAGRRK